MNYFITGTVLNDLHIQLHFISNLPKKMQLTNIYRSTYEV